VGLKEGIAFDLVDGLSRREDLLDRQTLEPALGLGRKYLFDEHHALQVSRLALSLFDQLKKVHRLGTRERRILMAAGILHDVGSFISLKGHHKHTLYIVMQSELPGFSPEEMRLVANVARYHRKTSPAPHHPFFTGLSSADRDRVWKLASILRTADALDREHLQRVTDVHVSVEGNTARLTLRGTGDLLLERWALERKIQMLCDYFGLKTTVRVQR
jgi:exopolyphosphatase/guanosine-5'-triphosphate,3'-diphosphate pyrophosphatase